MRRAAILVSATTLIVVGCRTSSPSNSPPEERLRQAAAATLELDSFRVERGMPGTDTSSRGIERVDYNAPDRVHLQVINLDSGDVVSETILIGTEFFTRAPGPGDGTAAQWTVGWDLPVEPFLRTVLFPLDALIEAREVEEENGALSFEARNAQNEVEEGQARIVDGLVASVELGSPASEGSRWTYSLFDSAPVVERPPADLVRSGGLPTCPPEGPQPIVCDS